MLPIYFPFTYITQQTAEAVGTFFKTMVVYQASAKPLPSEMQPLAASGFLDVRVPDASDQSRFDDVVKNFRSWGNLHFDNQGVKTAFSRLISEPVPFFNDSATSQIVADVKDELQSKQTSEASSMRFDARIFIELAQQFDRQSYEINQDLGRYDEKVKDLFTGIRGAGGLPDADYLSGPENSANNPDEYLIRRRLDAWSYLFQQDAVDSGILLTGSRFLLEHFLDNVPSAEKIQTYKCTLCPRGYDATLPIWQDNLMTTLASLVKASRPASADMPLSEFSAENGAPQVSLNLYLLPELRPLDCLAACVSKPVFRSNKQIPPSHIRNTVIGLVKHHGISIT